MVKRTIEGSGESIGGDEMSRLRMIEEDALSCGNCKWLGERHQKCSCCRRNHGMKDNYEEKTP